MILRRFEAVRVTGPGGFPVALLPRRARFFTYRRASEYADRVHNYMDMIGASGVRYEIWRRQ